jgi:hypothetical protein
LANFFIHKESASSVGIEYLKCVPKEADVHTLVHLIFSTKSELRTELNKADTNKFRKLLLLQQRQDFEHGRTVKVQGWILSETEARLCALAALT